MDSESGLFEPAIDASEETVFNSNEESECMLSGSVSKSHPLGESTMLERNVGLVSATALIVGTIIGKKCSMNHFELIEYYSYLAAII